MEALLQLPALTRLSFGTLDEDAMAYLPRFSHLRDLAVCADDMGISLVPQLASCNQLTALNLSSVMFQSYQLQALAHSLPLLTTLRFENCGFSGLTSPGALECFQSLPLLCHLSFDSDCTGMDLIHLVDNTFTSLSSLRSLEVSLPKNQLPLARILLTPPCKLMPQLERTVLSAVYGSE